MQQANEQQHAVETWDAPNLRAALNKKFNRARYVTLEQFFADPLWNRVWNADRDRFLRHIAAGTFNA